MMLPLPTHAEEGGSGHYAPGANASFIDALPGKPGLAIANYFNFYDGSASASRQLPLGGLVTAGLDASGLFRHSRSAVSNTAETTGGLLCCRRSHSICLVEGKGQVTGPLGITSTVPDKASGISDITLYPFMLDWTGLNGNLKYDVRLGIYAPTGDYEKGKLANVGKNDWTFEPAMALSYISSKIGLKLSAFAGMDFNTENHKTDYRSGTQFHLDMTIAEHLPFLGGIIGVGANAFYCQQITGDSGSGARLGDVKGRTIGIGPVLS